MTGHSQPVRLSFHATPHAKARTPSLRSATVALSQRDARKLLLASASLIHHDGGRLDR